MMSSEQKSRLLGRWAMSAQSAAGAGMMSSRQKPRFLPAGDEVMSAEIAGGRLA
jgi:hypothetical protein